MIDAFKRRKLQMLYAKIPSIECKKLCYGSCTSVGTLRIESKIKIEELGYNPLDVETKLDKLTDIGMTVEGALLAPCLLLKNNQCSLYNTRPFVCRMFGVTKRLKCPFGCEPKRWLSDKEAAKILLEIEKL